MRGTLGTIAELYTEVMKRFRRVFASIVVSASHAFHKPSSV